MVRDVKKIILIWRRHPLRRMMDLVSHNNVTNVMVVMKMTTMMMMMTTIRISFVYSHRIRILLEIMIMIHAIMNHLKHPVEGFLV